MAKHRHEHGLRLPKQAKGSRPANYSHAWRGSWDRPMKVDENLLHPFTVARMTDHNVRGTSERRRKKSA